ncbi:hypothetical protein LCGC14_0344610 [marine sediment metagenome]|uniref:Uncharacterized protein n=1 Tax=marine sediment metagenome TaxID=412755 RepID=A0A0F9TCM1_9ZZZZ
MDLDFNLCIDDECPSRDWCFRYTASPVKLGQAFFRESPHTGDDTVCIMFVSNKKRGKRSTFHKRVEKIK